ncbi:MAG: cysteine--tRNA ligase [Phycisphaerales bacterium]|nr:cysteine--tRNA ligase [Phycisphaerales bacterium]
MPPSTLRLYNTLTRRVEPVIPADPARITFYSCGPTVYDDAHIGNFRSFLAADVLRRWLESPLCELDDGRGGTHRGPRRVIHVMNITDVGHMTDDAEGGESGEDRMALAGRRLAEAKKAGKIPAGVTIDPTDPYQIARFYEDRFKEDGRRLGLKLIADGDSDPTLNPRATENIPGMIAVIQKLFERGFAYLVPGPGANAVYFDVQKFADYGELSGNTLEHLREGAGGRIAAEHQSGKRSPADFLLWKEDPRHIMKWPSPWGEGYPGWHIECTVMSAGRLLGEGEMRGLLARPRAGPAVIDLHSGGEDNIFPHHECEIAQSCAAFGADPAHGTFARHWFHARFLLVEGTKMSKSKGNFYTARDLFAKGIEPAALRLELIKTHYRSNANFTMQGLADSQKTVERWRRFAQLASSKPGPASDASARAARAFAEAMSDDLNIAAAIAAINTMVGEVSAPAAGDVEVLRMFDAALGILEREAPAAMTSDIGVFIGIEPSAEVSAKLEERRAARAAKDFKKSDQIRDELKAMGYAIKDVAGGKVEVTRS